MLASLRADMDGARTCPEHNAIASRYLPRVRALAKLPPHAAARKTAGNLAMGLASHPMECYGKPTFELDALVDALADLN